MIPAEKVSPRRLTPVEQEARAFEHYLRDERALEVERGERAHLDQHRPPFRVLFDETGAGVRAFDVLTTSVVVIVDSAGRVAYAGSGEKQDLAPRWSLDGSRLAFVSNRFDALAALPKTSVPMQATRCT